MAAQLQRGSGGAQPNSAQREQSAPSIYAANANDKDATDNSNSQRQLWLAKVLPFHYGYVVLIVCGVGLGMSGPGQTTTFGVLVGDESDSTSLMRQTGVSLTTSSALFMLATFVSAALMLRFGYLLDRLGPMWAMVVTALCLGISSSLLSLASSPGTLFLGLCALRLFGQGCMMLVPPYTVAMWWVERRGFAYAITLSIGSIGINYAYPMLAKSVMESPTATWRDVLRIIALICWCGTLPLGLLFYRDRPEAYGLLPDGRTVASVSKYKKLSRELAAPGSHRSRGKSPTIRMDGTKMARDAGVAPTDSEFTNVNSGAVENAKAETADAHAWGAKGALATVALWATCSGVCLIAMFSMGAWFHLVRLCRDAGIEPAQLSIVFLCQTIGQMVAKFGFSWMLDRVSVRCT
eukprot:SAG31_NODE_219_length_19926_cov_4.297297_2_plen_407_part_00